MCIYVYVAWAKGCFVVQQLHAAAMPALTDGTNLNFILLFKNNRDVRLIPVTGHFNKSG